jgi:hypothetical protein
VDASPRALEAGLTNPEELEKFVRAGVEVHTASRLHAKVFVFGRDAVIGSTNVSRRSANYLQEAALHTTERKMIRDARDFVLNHTGEQLTIPFLRKLRKIYQPPRFAPDGPPQSKSKRSKFPQQTPLWLMPLEYERWNERDHEQADKARSSARKRLKEGHKLDEFAYSGAKIQKLEEGEQVIHVLTDGKQTLVYPPGHILKIQRYRGARRVPSAIVFVAIPEYARARRLAQVREFLGDDRNVLAPLTDLRRVCVDAVAHALRQIWRPR